jgi:phenylpropionate dioxygenase-like ring-hydroxylating dioxygenase large terminal subunit
MDQVDLVSVLRQMVEYATTGTTASHPEGPRRNPVSTYTDPGQFELEKRKIFGGCPQLLGLSGDLSGPGDYRCFDDLGLPVVALRDREGRFRAFVNACAHRASRLVEGCGTLKGRFVCPYHGWSYGLDGRLEKIFKESTFGSVDPAQYGLTEIQSEEKFGLLFVAPRPGVSLDVAAHLGDLGPELGSWDLAAATPIKTGEWNLETNWKLALDTFCEGYHFGPLHADTVGRVAMTNTMTYDRYGSRQEHHRLGFPNKTVLALADKPESEWGEPFRHFNFVHFLFPNISLLVSPDAVELFQLYPGARVDQHTTRYTLYMRQPMDSEERWKAAKAHFDFIYSVVDQDDYRVSAGVQRNFNAGHVQYTTFGRNEPSLIDMHRSFREGAGLPPVDEPVL